MLYSGTFHLAYSSLFHHVFLRELKICSVQHIAVETHRGKSWVLCNAHTFLATFILKLYHFVHENIPFMAASALLKCIHYLAMATVAPGKIKPSTKSQHSLGLILAAGSVLQVLGYVIRPAVIIHHATFLARAIVHTE